MDTLSLEDQRNAEGELLRTQEWIRRQFEADEKRIKDELTKHDPIKNPKHYDFEIQPKEYLASLGVLEDFCVGSIIKYISRYKYKNGIEDVRKAAQNCQMLLDLLENKRP
tara:strand:- start:27173 stop:27502 length:330 start_codon:yes stop_codon:yes gene_type:complete